METEKRNLSRAQKVALWIMFGWLSLCLLGALGNSWYIVAVVCLALLAAIICLFKGILDAKFAWAVFGVSIVLPFVVMSALYPPEVETPKQTVEKQEKPKNSVEEEKNKESAKSEIKKEEKEQESPLSAKEKEVANAGFKQGTMFGMAGASNDEFSNMLDLADYVDGMDDKVKEMFEQMAGDEYDKEYNTPTNAEEKKLKRIYIEYFIKAMNGTMDAVDNLEKLGGKRK